MTVYVGNSSGLAKEVRRMYVGVDGVATKVQKAYVGDSNGIARLVWEFPTAILPSAYQQVEYIRSTEKQQYIDTGITGNVTSTVPQKVTMKMAYQALSGTVRCFGALASTTNQISIGCAGGTRWAFGYNGYNSIGTDISVGQVYDLEAYYSYSERYFNVNNTQIFRNTVSKAINTSRTFYIFRSNQGTVDAVQMDLYGCKIYNNGTLVRDFYPCYRKADSVSGLYDMVNDAFYRNALNNTDNFDVGPNYEGEL